MDDAKKQDKINLKINIGTYFGLAPREENGMYCSNKPCCKSL